MKSLATAAFATLALISLVPCCLTQPASAAEAQAAYSTATLEIEGMTCGSCATAVKIVLQKTPGVAAARVSYEEKRAVVSYDAAKTTPEKIAAAVRSQLPYTVRPADVPHPKVGTTTGAVEGSCAAAATPAGVAIPLAGYHADELRSAFNAAKDRVRVVALLSPTCGACQQGQRAVQSVFTKYATDQRLRGFVVWLPMLKNDNASAAAAQAGAFTDPRVVQRWDSSRTSGHLLAKTLKLNTPAWDVYLVYAPGVTWNGDDAPQPTFWMHQLRSDSGADQKACLNPAALIAKVGELLGKKA